MLDRGGDDVVALVLVELDHALDGEVVGLGGAAGEDDLLRLGVDQAGDPLAPRLGRLLRLPAVAVAPAGRVTEGLGEIGHHRLEHPRIERGRGVVVHVDSLAVHAGGTSDYPIIQTCWVHYHCALPSCQPRPALVPISETLF